MANKFIQVDAPLKGVNRAFGRERQPAGTCYDALNVLPFDRSGRLRVGERAGTGKLWAAAVGSGTSFVQLLQQTVISVSAGSVLLGSTFIDEPFTYANGSLPTVAPIWSTYTGTGTMTPNSSAVAVSSSKAVENVSTGQALLVTAPALGSAYVLRMTVQTTSTPTASNRLFQMHMRAGASPATNKLVLVVNVNSSGPYVRLVSGSGTTAITPSSGTAAATLAASFFAANTPYTLEARWNGDTYSVLLNGTELFNGVTSTFNTNKNVGFGFDSVGSLGGTVDDFQVFQSVRAAVSRQTDIFSVSNGTIYQGNIGVQATAVTNGSSVLGSDTQPSAAALFGKMYLVDGFTDIVQLDIASRTVSTFTPSAGTETKATLGQYSIAVPWRGRLVLGRDRLNPQNFAASKVGDPTNWDYSQTTPDAAWAGNASKAGQISDPITALIPASDDVLIIGTDHGIWQMRGDISDGGSIDLVSDAVGILSPTAWTKSPDGTVYFVGTTGLFAIAPGGRTLTNLSDQAYNQFFSAINRKTQYVNLAWDRDRHGAFIFVTPVVATGTGGVHLFYDARNGGFWPIQYPDSFGPTASAVYDGDNPSDRYLMLGGRTGFVQIVSDTQRRDDGTGITSKLVLGPFHPATGDALLSAAVINMGDLGTADVGNEAVWNANILMAGGKTAYDVTAGTPTASYTANLGEDRRQRTLRQRVRGEWFTLTFSNSSSGDYWSFESAQLEFNPLGRNRRVL